MNKAPVDGNISLPHVMSSPDAPSTDASLIPEIGTDPGAAVRADLPYAAVEHVREHLDASDDLLARALGVSARMLKRRRETGTLTTDESDRLVLLAEIVAPACHASDSADLAHEWLHTPHSMLGGETPLDHMDTVAGMDEVKTMSSHIEYGLPA